MTEYTHGLRCDILRSHFSSAHGGISDRFFEVTIVGPGVPQIHEVTYNTPAVVVTETAYGHFLRPAEDSDWYVASGAYVIHSGSRSEWAKLFGHALPIPLHDHIRH